MAPIGEALGNFAEWLYGLGPVGAGVYGAANRALIPVGMHHFLNSFIWFSAGECTNAAGEDHDRQRDQHEQGDQPADAAGLR